MSTDKEPGTPENELETLRRRVRELEADQVRLRRVERALRDSQATTRALLDASRERAVLLDAEGTILAANDPAARSVGKTVPEMIGRPIHEFVPADLAENRMRILAEVFRTGRPRRFEDQRAGRRLDNNVHPIADADGKISRVAVFTRDVTEQRRAEEALRESEKRYRILFDAAPVGIGIADPEGHVLAGNKTMLEITGFTLEEFKRIDLASIYAVPEQRTLLLKTLKESGRARDFEVDLKRKDGTTYSALLNVDLIELGGRQLVLTTCRDITDRKQAWQALEESRQSERAFREQLAALHAVTMALSTVHSFQELCRRAVGLGLEKLGFDRLGLWLRTGRPNEVRGSFGTDERGNLRDESDSVTVVKPGSFVDKVLSDEVRLAAKPDTPLRDDHDRPVGRGAAAMASLWDGERIIGYISADDLLGRRPLSDNQCELLGLYASALGHLCSRTRAHEALRDSETRYRALVERIPAITYLAALDEASTTTYVSPQMEDFLGFSPADYKADPDTWRKRLHPEDRERVLAEVRQAHVARQRFLSEYRMLARDGRVVWMRDDASVVHDERGKPLFLQGVMFDITDRKRAEEELRVKDSAIESSLNAIALSDLDGKLTYVNPSFVRLWGYDSEEEVLGKPVFSFWRQAKEAGRVAEEVKRQGSWSGELRAKRKDGTGFDASLSSSVVTNERGQPICMMGSFMDITQRKRAEEALRQSKDRLQHVIDNTSDIIFEIDLKGNYTFGNLAAERVTGYPLEKLLTMNMGELIAPEYREAIFARLRDRMRGKPLAQPVTFDIVHRDGHRVTLELTTTGIYGDGKLTGVEGIARDITARVRAERELRAARARLASARDEERRRLAGELHDSVGQGVIAMKLSLGSVVHECRRRCPATRAAKVDKALSQCDELIGEVRRVGRGLYPPILESLGLGPALHQLAQDFGAQSRVKLDCLVPDDLGRFPRDVEIAMFRIAQEAVTNAIRHGNARRVRVGLSREGGRAVLTVTDNGKGFDPAEAGGKGLGLSRMRERVQTLGGELEITSRKGRTRIAAAAPTEKADDDGK